MSKRLSEAQNIITYAINALLPRLSLCGSKAFMGYTD